MKKSSILITLIHVLALGGAAGQQKQTIYLSGYTFTPGKKEIGIVKLTDNDQVKAITISGTDAASFRTGKGSSLLLNKKVKPDVKWMDITITAHTASGSDISGDFRIVRDEFIHNTVIAHRGAWKNTGTPQNSIASLKNAVAIGCEGSEFDVHLTSDSVLIINHDDVIQGLPIEKTSSAELLQLKLSNGETLPTLKDYLTAGIDQNKTRLILEIKPSVISSERGIALTHKVIGMVRACRAEAWVDYISFDYDICKEVLKLAPPAQVTYLKGDKDPAQLQADHLTGLDYHFSVMQKNPGWIKDAHDRKLTVNVWTVDDGQLMDWLIGEKADYITTNEPELLLKKLKQ